MQSKLINKIAFRFYPKYNKIAYTFNTSVDSIHLDKIDDTARNNISSWITALRSNQFEQGHHILCNTTNNQNFYCCLGVLQKINATLIPQEGSNSILMSFLRNEDFINVTKLYTHLSYSDLELHNQIFFSTLNDQAKFTFKQIADVLQFILDVTKGK